MKVALRDINYQFLANAYTTIVGFALFAGLAHFLAPLEFGLYSLGTVVAAVVYTLGQAGFVSLAYSEIDRSELIRNTLFWANIIVACCLVIPADALIYGIIYNSDRKAFMACIVTTLLITSISEIANVALLTAKRFQALAAKQVAVQTIGAAATIFAAFNGLGAWSLVIQRCVTGLLEIVLVFSLLRWLPRFAFDYREFRRLLPTAVGFSVNSSLSVLETRFSDFVLAAVSTLDQVAVYRIASRVIDAIASLVCQPIAAVTSATIAAAPPSVRGTAYLAHVQLLLWVGSAPFAGLLCFGDIAVPLVFGATWIESGVVAQILAAQFFLAGPVWMTESALIAAGRPKDLVKLRFLAALVSGPLIVVFAMLGTKYVALAVSLRAMILLPLYVRVTHFLTALSTYQAMKITFHPYLVAILSASVARLTFEAARALGGETVLALSTGIIVGGLVFLGLFLNFGRSELASILVWRHR
jgi:O-antigen/teichoic acid export membrane protein